MILVPLIRPVIRKSLEVTETRIRTELLKSKETKATYKAIEARVGRKSTRVRVVVKKIGENGKYYFQSVMKYN